MKKLVLLMLSVALIGSGLKAQVAPSPLAEGVKLLNYEKNKSALEFFKTALDKNPADPETTFWYGQALLAQNYNGVPTPEYIQKAKALYQQALQAKGNDAWLLVGMAHIQSLEGADAALIKNNLELAITTSKVEKGKNKGKNNADIVNAIGRVYAELPMNIGDHHYAVEKLKEVVSSYDEATINPNLFLNLGINYLKLGGENGGEAVSAFNKAIDRDSKNAYAFYRIGKIYQSQSNKEIFEENYNKAVAIDPTIAPVYVSLYTYYASIDTTKARKNLDLFLQYADKDPAFDYLYADYLFQVAQYDASLAKAKSLEAAIGIETYPRIAVLLAYNYDRKGDSISAKKYIEQFINNNPTDKILANDYVLAVKVLSKFSGNESGVAAILEKAIASEPNNKANAMKLYKLGYEMFEKANMYADAAKWYAKYAAVRGVKDETYYYKTASIAVNAKDGVTAAATAKEYIAAFPDKQNGYLYNVKAARLLDTANNLGILFEAINLQNTYLVKDTEKNKQALINNYYTLIGYYNETKAYDNAVLMCDKVLELVPNDPTTTQAKAQFVKNIEILKKMVDGKGGKVAPEKAATDTTNGKPAIPKKN
jgi:tetratricopeptide (TPR) repeat protein